VGVTVSVCKGKISKNMPSKRGLGVRKLKCRVWNNGFGFI
jgi:hypothetical protein